MLCQMDNEGQVQCWLTDAYLACGVLGETWSCYERLRVFLGGHVHSFVSMTMQEVTTVPVPSMKSLRNHRMNWEEPCSMWPRSQQKATKSSDQFILEC